MFMLMVVNRQWSTCKPCLLEFISHTGNQEPVLREKVETICCLCFSRFTSDPYEMNPVQNLFLVGIQAAAGDSWNEESADLLQPASGAL